jgi:hypothetical protein
MLGDAERSIAKFFGHLFASQNRCLTRNLRVLEDDTLLPAIKPISAKMTPPTVRS